MSSLLWKVQLFGPLRVVRLASGEVVARFRTQKTAALLAYLALTPGRRVSREVLIDLFWPEQDLKSGRNALSVALSSLRAQLEPPGVDTGSVVEADRLTVALSARTVTTDLTEGSAEGELLSGIYDDWAEAERTRRGASATPRGLAALVGWREQEGVRLSLHGQVAEALQFARRQPGGAVVHVGEGAAQEHTRQLAARMPVGAIHLTPVAESVLREAGALDGWQLAPADEHHLSLRQAIPPDAPPALLGRADEQSQLATWLATEKIITVVGTAGVGKTALARALLADQEGVGIVALAPLPPGTDAEGLARAALSALFPAQADLPGPASTRLTESLAGSAYERVFWDNAEHVSSGLGTLLSQLPTPALVTSRRALELPGERVLELGPLLPASKDTALSELAKAPAVALFLERARAVRPDFPLNARSAPEILSLLERLDYLPLGIELAAARVGEVSLSRLLERLDESLDALAGRRGRSLRAALQASWRLLSPDEAQAAARLSAFPDGWSETTCAELSESLNTLQSLRASSLAVLSEGRWRMLETVRAFAQEASPEPDRSLVSWAFQLATRAEGDAWGSALGPWLARLGAERQNLDAALERATPEEVLTLLARLGRLYLVRAWWQDGAARLESAFERASESLAQADPTLWSRARATLAHFTIGLGDHGRALKLFEEAELVAPAEPERTAAREGQGIVLGFQGEAVRATAILGDVLESHRRAGRAAGEARALLHLGHLMAAQHGAPAAGPLWDDCLAAARRAGDLTREASVLNAMANAAVFRGDDAQAFAQFSRALSLYEALGSPRGRTSVLSNLGMLAWARGRTEEAIGYVTEALALDRELGDRPDIGRQLCSLGHLLGWSGSFDEARTTLSEAEALARTLGDTRLLGDLCLTQGEVARRSGDLSHSARMFFEGLSIHSDCGDADIAAWTLEELAALALALGKKSEAATLLSSASQLRTEQDAPLPPIARPDRDALALALGPADPLPWDDARTLALTVCASSGSVNKPAA